MNSRKELIRQTYEQYKSYARTAKILGISRQRVHQVIKNYKTIDNMELYITAFKKICEYCEINTSTEIHHIDKNSSHNRLTNLMSCCNPCHKQQHKKTSAEEVYTLYKQGMSIYSIAVKLNISPSYGYKLKREHEKTLKLRVVQ